MSQPKYVTVIGQIIEQRTGLPPAYKQVIVKGKSISEVGSKGEALIIRETHGEWPIAGATFSVEYIALP